MAEKQKIILPGEKITTEEEYAPGINTYAENGIIKSSVMGIAKLDDLTKEASVSGKTVTGITYGDIVTGRVMLVKESNAVIELLSAENGKKIMGMKIAQIPIRNISTEYISEIRKTMKIGDIVRAKVEMASPLAIDLATNEKGLGVIKAYCTTCREEMQFSNEKMMCLHCGSVEERKWFEAEQKPREFAPRREGGFNDRRGGFDRGRGGFGGGRREGGFGGRRSFGGPRGDRGGYGEHRSFDGQSNGYGGQRSFGSDRGGFSQNRGEGRSFSGNRDRPFGDNRGYGGGVRGDRGGYGEQRFQNRGPRRDAGSSGQEQN